MAVSVRAGSGWRRSPRRPAQPTREPPGRLGDAVGRGSADEARGRHRPHGRCSDEAWQMATQANGREGGARCAPAPGDHCDGAPGARSARVAGRAGAAAGPRAGQAALRGPLAQAGGGGGRAPLPGRRRLRLLAGTEQGSGPDSIRGAGGGSGLGENQHATNVQVHGGSGQGRRGPDRSGNRKARSNARASSQGSARSTSVASEPVPAPPEPPPVAEPVAAPQPAPAPVPASSPSSSTSSQAKGAGGCPPEFGYEC